MRFVNAALMCKITNPVGIVTLIRGMNMLSEETRKDIVTAIRRAYAEYPKSDGTVDTMIDQAIRIGFVRGQSDARKESGWARKEPDWVNEFGFKG